MSIGDKIIFAKDAIECNNHFLFNKMRVGIIILIFLCKMKDFINKINDLFIKRSGRMNRNGINFFFFLR
jgi:hypothetical protein